MAKGMMVVRFGYGTKYLCSASTAAKLLELVPELSEVSTVYAQEEKLHGEAHYADGKIDFHAEVVAGDLFVHPTRDAAKAAAQAEVDEKLRIKRAEENLQLAKSEE